MLRFIKNFFIFVFIVAGLYLVYLGLQIELKPFYTVEFVGYNIKTIEVREGELATKPEDPTKDDYVFVGWLDGDEIFDFNTPVTRDLSLVAKFEPKYTDDVYIVTFDTDGGSSIQNQSLNGNMLVVMPENPTKKGYVFDEWQLDGKTFDFNTPVTSNFTLKATWKEATKYTVTFDTDGGSTVKSKLVYDGSPVAKPANPTKKGYNFSSWTLNDTEYDFSTPVTSDITLKATWVELDTIIVTFDSNGGSSVEKQEVKYGYKLTAPKNPAKDGYVFNGWYLDNKKFDFNTKITTTITLKAAWTPIAKKISAEQALSYCNTAVGVNFTNYYAAREVQGSPKNMTSEGYGWVYQIIFPEKTYNSKSIKAECTIYYKDKKWNKLSGYLEVKDIEDNY